ncbi:hypothetical protein [Streptomyces sp. NBC_00236]|uniref:hypothetical protein n=1 Tax=Streptomyces sp. NBC_00236 TaxID=2903639 RepID=UPI002E2A190E|nr:hypothetical protein [Streptomyces sp. NBC_00236]
MDEAVVTSLIAAGAAIGGGVGTGRPGGGVEQGRPAEACVGYRSAVDAGLLDAGEGLLSAPAVHAPRAVSARTVKRLRTTGPQAE